MDTYMTVKGQVVIPSKIRRQLGVTEGTRIQVEVEESGQRIILTPITPAYVQGIRGKYRGRALLRALANEKADRAK
jgi:AbrB family looped-hinge helix DNA binding protein